MNSLKRLWRMLWPDRRLPPPLPDQRCSIQSFHHMHRRW